jgi:CheY-like chemotaxis protein
MSFWKRKSSVASFCQLPISWKIVSELGKSQLWTARKRFSIVDYLVLDIELPDINGFDLQQELGTKDVQIPIIFLTGHGDIAMSVLAIKAGELEFLTKPFEDEHLLEASERDAETDGDAGRDTEISMCNTYNAASLWSGVPPLSVNLFDPAERLLDRGALKRVFVMLIEQRIAVIAGTNGIARQ